MTPNDYRVLLINLSTQFGGTDVRVLSQAKALQSRVDHCAVAVLEGSKLHNRMILEGLPHHAIAHKRNSPQLLSSLRNIMKTHQYNIVDTHNVISIFWGQLAAWQAGVAGRVVTVHSDYIRENPNLKGRAYDAVLQASRLTVKAYIQVTEELQQTALNRGIKNTTWIPNAVAMPDSPLQQKDTSSYDEWGFATDDRVIGIVGRLHPVKGHQYLIDALGLLPDMPKIKLLIVGDGDLRDALEQQVNALDIADRVHFTGFRDDIAHIMQSIDALCIASLSEAHPFVLLEAAAYARPIIATSVGGLKTLLRDKDTALMVEASNPEQLADALKYLATHPDEAQRLGVSAYEMVKAQFSTEKIIHSILNIYEKAVHEG
ncbi:MAG: glycosyltransferase family 4 protein [Phototrophicaceae bacterium]